MALHSALGLLVLLMTCLALGLEEDDWRNACTLKAAESLEAYQSCLNHSRVRRAAGEYGDRRHSRDPRPRIPFHQRDEGHPCNDYTRLNEPRRSVSHVIPHLTDNGDLDTSGDALCDRALKKRWYRFEGAAGGKMPEICPNDFSCGTHAPIWLNGPHPSRRGEVKDVQVCVSLAGVCCTRRWNIQVANCGNFFSYRLVDTPGCFMAYCAGDSVKCPPGTSSPNGYGPSCTADFPKLHGRAILSHEAVMNKLLFHCDYQGNLPPGATLDVQWFLQGDASEENREDKLPVFEEHIGVKRRSTLPEDKWLHHMGSSVYCRFVTTARGHGGQLSTQMVESEKFFAGIKILNRVIRVSEADKAGHIQVQSTVPVRCLPQFGGACSIDISLATEPLPQGRTCVGGQMQQVVFGDCNIMITPDNWQQVHNVSVKAVRDFYRDGNRAMRLSFKPIFSTTTSEIWDNYQLPEVEVIAEDVHTSICSTTGDPHYSTFDGLYYHMYLEGEFVLYKSTKFPIQVNTRVQKCGRSQGVEVTCNCGVAVMVEDDAIVIDKCKKVNRKLAMGDKFPDGYETLNRYALQQGESFVDGLKVIERDEGRKYTIMLPTGGFVDFQIGENWINIFVHASSDDFASTEGMCGTFDDDTANDLTYADGRTVSRISHGAGCGENQDVCAFSNSWRVATEDTLFGPVITKKLPEHEFFSKERYCKCIKQPDGDSQVECNYNYDVQNCAAREGAEELGGGGGYGGGTGGVDRTQELKIHSETVMKKMQEGNAIHKVDRRKWDRYQNMIIDADGNPVPGAEERTRKSMEQVRRQLERQEQERLSGGHVVEQQQQQQKTREQVVEEQNLLLEEREALIRQREKDWKERQGLSGRGVAAVDRGQDHREGVGAPNRPATREEQMRERERLIREREEERQRQMAERGLLLEARNSNHGGRGKTEEELIREKEEARRKEILGRRDQDERQRKDRAREFEDQGRASLMQENDRARHFEGQERTRLIEEQARERLAKENERARIMKEHERARMEDSMTQEQDRIRFESRERVRIIEDQENARLMEQARLMAEKEDMLARARQEFVSGIGNEAISHEAYTKQLHSTTNPESSVPKDQANHRDPHLQDNSKDIPEVRLDNDLLQQRFLNKRRRAQQAFVDNYRPQGPRAEEEELANRTSGTGAGIDNTIAAFDKFLSPWFNDGISDYQLDYFNMDFMADEGFVGHEPSWPTASGITEHGAKRHCIKYIMRSSVGRMCNKIVPDKLQSILTSCMTDIKVTDNLQWAMSALTSLISECTGEIQTDATLWEQAPDTDAMLGDQPRPVPKAHRMLQNICPNDCYKQGRCVQGTCRCRNGYAGADCSVKKWMPPQVLYLQEHGMCDIKSRMCRYISVYGTGFRRDTSITCQFKQADDVAVHTAATFETFEHIICSLPQHNVGTGNPDYGEHAPFQQYTLTVLQDNVAAQAVPVVVYDSSCQDCSVYDHEFFCYLKFNTCEVNGVCFAAGDRHPDDCCRVCDPKQATTALVTFQDTASLYAITPVEAVYVVASGDAWFMHVSARGPYGCDAAYEVSQPSRGLRVTRTLDGIDVELDTDVVGTYQLGILARDPCGGVTTKKYAVYVISKEGLGSDYLFNMCANDAPPVFPASTNLNIVAVPNELLKIQFEAVDPEGTAVNYFIMQLMVRSQYMSITDSGLMRYVAPSTGSTDILVIKAQDECGSNGEVPITIATRSCPCRQGTCVPDPGYPRGTGMYMCECVTLQGERYACPETYVQVAP